MEDIKSVSLLEAEIEALERGAGLITPPTQDVEVEEEEEEPEVHVEPDAEDPFKKRYSDLRRHAQQKENAHKEEIEDLKRQIASLKEAPAMPVSVEEVKDWAEKNPKAAEIIRSLAREQAKSETPRGELLKVQSEVDKIRQEARIRKAHPDLDDITSDDAFHDWAEAQPKKIQDMVYGKDADEVIWAINEYKRHSNTGQKTNPDKEAAKAVGKNKTAEVPGKGPRSFTESQVNSMSMPEYEANEEAIQASIRGGTFVYDLSGGAR